MVGEMGASANTELRQRDEESCYRDEAFLVSRRSPSYSSACEEVAPTVAAGSRLEDTEQNAHQSVDVEYTTSCYRSIGLALTLIRIHWRMT